MDDTLNSDLVKIDKWGRANKVAFNAAKPNAVCYLASESSILAKKFVWVV